MDVVPPELWITPVTLVFFILGMLGNTLTIYIFARNKKERKNKVFELILAGFDVYAMVVSLPLHAVHFFKDPIISVEVKNTIAVPCIHGYHITILCSAICRYVAVFYPYKFGLFFEKWQKRFFVIIFSFVFLVFTRMFIVEIHFGLKGMFYDRIVLTFSSLAIIFILYIKITLKIKTFNNTVRPTPTVQSIAMTQISSDQIQAQTQPGAQNILINRKRHLVALKTFGAVTICLMTSYCLKFLTLIGYLPLPLIYLYFLNHISNPPIYYMFNKEYRKQVWKLICGREHTVTQ